MVKFIFTSLLMVLANSVYSFTECTVKLEKMWAGDEGWIWIYYTDGGSSKVGPNDVDQKNIISMAMTGLVSGNSIVVRYEADNVNCKDVARGDVRGIYLLSN